MDKVPTAVKSAIPWAGILNILAAVVYGASPIDLIPDVLILIGWVDDAIAIPMFLAFAFLAFAKHKKAMRTQKSAETVVNTVAREPQIPNSY